MSNWGVSKGDWLDAIRDSLDGIIYTPPKSSTDSYDLDELFEEFEKMLNPESEPKLIELDTGSGKTVCRHEWEKTGCSPFTNKQWYNCIHCEIAKEKVLTNT